MKTILFDLDSTLLQMDQELFLKLYFKGVKDKFSSIVEDIDTFMKVFGKTAYDILKNDGSRTNKELFFSEFSKYIPVDGLEEQFNSYYENEFNEISTIVKKSNISKLIVDELNKQGYNLYLATNPLFPSICTEARMSWAGLKKSDFKYISTYENSTFSKPKLEYFQEFAKKNNFKLDDAIMIGNDLNDDFSCLPDSVRKILITDFLINKNNKDISNFEKYTLEDFYLYILNNKL